MSEPIRFFFDNHLPNAVVANLRDACVDVLTAHGAGRSRFPDDDLLRLATAEGRVVVSEDEDFKRLAADFQARGEPFAGVVFCAQAKYVNRPGRLTVDLLTLHGVFTAADMLNHLEYL